MHYVYAISSCTRNYIYVGMTQDVAQRLLKHNSGYERTTKPYAPFNLLYTEELPSREAARQREKYWKSGIGKEKLKTLREAGIS